jgi:predicted DNA-binding transcriptional regulator AlpA
MKKSNTKRPPPPRRRPVKNVPAQTVVTTVASSPYPANKRFVFKEEVLERIGVSFVSLWRWMADGKFPTARTVGGQSAWLASEIDDWMENCPLRQYKSREVA